MVKFYLFCFCLLLISKNYAQDSLKNESRKKISAIEIRQQKNQMIKSDKIESLEIYTNDFFSKNPSPSLFESLQNINGIRPQIQCNICNESVSRNHFKRHEKTQKHILNLAEVKTI
jgi:outer membrane receptor for ferrienterochelin and colicins